MDNLQKLDLSSFQNLDAFMDLRKYCAVERCRFGSFGTSSSLDLSVEKVDAAFFFPISLIENLSALGQSTSKSLWGRTNIRRNRLLNSGPAGLLPKRDLLCIYIS